MEKSKEICEDLIENDSDFAQEYNQLMKMRCRKGPLHMSK